MPQLRQNIVTGEWVVVAPERSKRPHDFVNDKKDRPSNTDGCPFCTHGPAYQTQLKPYETELTYIIPNKFPAFVSEGEHEVRSYYPESGFYTAKPAAGNHDVLVIKDHKQRLPEITVPALTDMFLSMKKRYVHYRKDPSIDYVMAIYNHGKVAGASIDHPHAQIFASAIVPDDIRKEMHGSEHYHELNGHCVFCEIITHEQNEKVRVLAETDHFIMFTFFASRFPFEIWILPKEHQSQFENISTKEAADLAEILKTGLSMLDSTLHDPDLNFYLHSLPTTSQDAEYYHWHLEIAPRLSIWAGYELGSGTIIDVVSPEKAAEFLISSNSPSTK